MAVPGVVRFGALDYVVFIALMLSSAFIGVYIGFFAKRKQNTTVEYLLGSKSMGFFPITMSMIASSISGVTLLGVPTEIYTYGTQFSLNAITDIMVCTVTAIVFVPVYYNLQVTSTYEYLEMRYDKSIRYLLAASYCIQSNIYMPLVIYVPALALNQVTGINIFVISTISTAICAFYTCVGGLRAVVWTDTLQTCSMGLGTLVVVVVGVIQVGGLGEVLKRAEESERLVFFNMDTDPYILHTFWSIMIGGFLGWLGGMAGSQSTLQRCIALPTLKQAQRATILTSFGSATFVVFSVFTGLAIYAKYHDCDPIFSKAIAKSDQILPYFVADIGSAIPGIAGLFVAGIFAAALSSLSTSLNSVSCVLLNDLIKPCLSRPLTEYRSSLILKLIVLALGLLTTVLVFLVEYLGTLFQVSRTFGGITGSARLGIFLFGVTVPWVKAKAVLIGGVITCVLMTTRIVGMQRAITSGDLVFPKKLVSVDACPEFMENYLNVSMAYNFEAQYEKNKEVFWIFRFSYFYNAVISLVLMVITTGLVSCFTGVNDPRDMNYDLFSPVIRRFLPARRTSREPSRKQAKTNSEVPDEEIELKHTE